MTKRNVVIIGVILAIACLVAGAFFASWYWLNFNAQFMTSGLVLRTQADIITKVAVLDYMRAGRFEDATNFLETLVDGDLITAGALARDGHKFTANMLNAAASELKARKASGYKPADPTVRAGVQETLRLLAADAVAGGAQQDAPGDAPKAARP